VLCAIRRVTRVTDSHRPARATAPRQQSVRTGHRAMQQISLHRSSVRTDCRGTDLHSLFSFGFLATAACPESRSCSAMFLSDLVTSASEKAWLEKDMKQDMAWNYLPDRHTVVSKRRVYPDTAKTQKGF